MTPGHRPDSTQERRFPWLFIAGSALAHLLLVALLAIPWPSWDAAPSAGADAPATVEVVMVRQPAQVQGRPVQGQPAAATDARPAPAAAAPAPPPVPPGGTLPSPPPSAAASLPASPAPPAPEVNLGGDPSDPWSVRSDTIRPPAPDARYRNLPPRYPAEAVALGESGTVGLVIHVAADGTAEGVDVVESSGFPVLDREARRAVGLWRFAPARRDGIPVPFDYPFAIHFSGN